MLSKRVAAEQGEMASLRAEILRLSSVSVQNLETGSVEYVSREASTGYLDPSSESAEPIDSRVRAAERAGACVARNLTENVNVKTERLETQNGFSPSSREVRR